MNSQSDGPSIKSLFIFWGCVVAFVGMFVEMAIQSDYNFRHREPMTPFQECSQVDRTWVSGLGASVMISFNVGGLTCKFIADPITWHKTNPGERYRISGFRNSHWCSVREMGPRC
jgi:hypothetical protein